MPAPAAELEIIEAAEPVQVLPDHSIGGVKEVRTVAVDQKSMSVELVVCIATHVRAPVDQEDGLVGVRRQPFGDDRAGEAGADH